jgi:transglutaminase-like putative cysteine protease
VIAAQSQAKVRASVGSEALVALALALALALVSASASAAETRTFHVTHELRVARAATVWVPLPSDDAWQTVRDLRVDGAAWERVYDPRWGNAAARLHPTAAATITVRYEVTRHERGAELARATGQPAPSGYAAWLQPDARVPLDARVRKIAADVTAGKTTPLLRARAAYDYVLSTMRYDKPTGAGQGWGQGDIEWACDKKYGNCTDFHALFIGLLRASGIPARFSIGYSIPSGGGGDIAGYHCWADFYVDGVGWVPVDASEAWKHKERADYFFGHHDSDRVQVATGRDVPLPGARGPSLNYFVYPYAEAADGAPVEVTRKTSYAP